MSATGNYFHTGKENCSYLSNAYSVCSSTDTTKKASFYKKIACTSYFNGNIQTNFPLLLTDVCVVSNQIGGSTGAKLVRKGKEKFIQKGDSPGGPGHTRAEFWANKIYGVMGVPVPKVKLYEETCRNKSGKLVSSGPQMLSEYIEGKSLEEFLKSVNEDVKCRTLKQLAQHFVLDALLANWDVFGLYKDNIIVNEEGIPHRVDNGSSFDYRAQGGKKGIAWGSKVNELKTMREHANNRFCYRYLKDKDIALQIKSVLDSQEKILSVVPKCYREVVVARLNDLREQYPKFLKGKVSSNSLKRFYELQDEAEKIQIFEGFIILLNSLKKEELDDEVIRKHIFCGVICNDNLELEDKGKCIKKLYSHCKGDFYSFFESQVDVIRVLLNDNYRSEESHLLEFDKQLDEVAKKNPGEVILYDFLMDRLDPILKEYTEKKLEKRRQKELFMGIMKKFPIRDNLSGENEIWKLAQQSVTEILMDEDIYEEDVEFVLKKLFQKINSKGILKAHLSIWELPEHLSQYRAEYQCIFRLTKSIDKIALPEFIKTYRFLLEQKNGLVPDRLIDFSELRNNVESYPLYDNHATLLMKRVKFGEVQKLTIEQVLQVANDISRFFPMPIPKWIDAEQLVKKVLRYIDENGDVVKKNPVLATRLHHALHRIAQIEMVMGRFEEGLSIQALAMRTFPLGSSHPLHKMDEAILEQTKKSPLVSFGANFSGLGTTTLKNGHLHVINRKVDNVPTNCFDFYINHYARDELVFVLKGIENNLDAFKKFLPSELCSEVKIATNVPHVFKRELQSGHVTTDSPLVPGDAKATVIEFVGVGKIVIGTDKEMGSLYNWINVEIKAGMQSGLGLLALNQILCLIGIGPVLGLQPPEVDRRMKIAQLTRAYEPFVSTRLDSTSELYMIPLKELITIIVSESPKMRNVFKKYLRDRPKLMKKKEIMPGKFMWHVTDFSDQVRRSGAWGLMQGVGQLTFDIACESLIQIIRGGTTSTLERFKAGKIIAGASSDTDLASGGGDQVFTRMVTKKTSQVDIKKIDFSGHIQILWSLGAVNRVSYGFDEDKCGGKNRFNPVDYIDYQRRKSLIDLAHVLSADNINNEVMVKNYISPKLMEGLVVATEKKREKLIDLLTTVGLIEKVDEIPYIMGKKAKDFIRVGRQFQQQWWI